MAIKPTCNKCGNELTEFGGILLSPPDDQDQVLKTHLCVSCYAEIMEDIPNKPSAS